MIDLGKVVFIHTESRHSKSIKHVTNSLRRVLVVGQNLGTKVLADTS